MRGREEGGAYYWYPSFLKEKPGPGLVWLSGLGAGLQNKRSLVQIPVRELASIAGQVPSCGLTRDN